MLSSTADHLFWMSRLIERAENTARLLDVTYRMSLLPSGTIHPNQEWTAVLNTVGLFNDYVSRYPEVNADGVLKFMAMDADNESSIYNCLQQARENARAVRGSISVEMWEALNAAWLDIRYRSWSQIKAGGISEFFDWAKDRSNLFRGVTHGTLLRDEGFSFIRLGTWLERGDNTARILDVKYHVLLPSVQDVGGAADYYQWGALLRSVSAFVAYRRIYRDVITPRRVAELLILRADMPRSLHGCMTEVYRAVRWIGGASSREVERRAGQLHSELHFARIEDVFEQGMHEYLTEFLEQTWDLAEEINRAYFWSMAA
ncbi:MAG TPA: alpha-E domain-containing protein [Pelomicrobium sp.]|nr:alpha-E domain-containing protein [Pelomicrobium sp.]